jgi:PKD repeat protein
VLRDAALLYYEVFASEIRAYVLKLVTNPTSLPVPATIALAHPLTPAPAPSAPQAAFARAPAGGAAPLEVAFADLSPGLPTQWLWDFGDGATSSERHPVHVYASAGSYDVALTASNASGADAGELVAAVEVLPPPPSLTFFPLADARVSEAEPATNFGSSAALRARLLPGGGFESYLRFDVSGLAGVRVVAAELRLYVTDPSPLGGFVTAAPGGWSESALTWQNAPGVGAGLLDSAELVLPDTWVVFDVSAAVQGEGAVELGLSSASGNSVAYSSREGAQPPRLVVYTAPALPSLGAAGLALLGALVAAAGIRALRR